MNKKEANIIGTKIGIYEVLYECDFKANDGHRMFHVKCTKCGWETNIQMHRIKDTKACQHLDIFGKYKQYYSWKNKKLRSIFQGMKDRCYNSNNKDYKTYGGKGIKICEEWLNSEEAFEDWSLNNNWVEGLTIDRIDSDKDYCPDNCRWITASNNSKYKSTTKIIEVDDIKHTGREWPEILNLGTNVINTMLRKYPEEQVKEFIRRRLKDLNKKSNGKSWMKIYGIE